MNEIWIPAIYIYADGTKVDFTGLYEVSNLAKVKHLPHTRIKRGFEYHYGEKISDYSNQNQRYCDTYFIKDGEKYKIQIHRLVLSSFQPESDTYECINHRDLNTHNNHLDNLEWCDSTYNNNYLDRNEKLSKSLTGMYNVTGGCKIVLQYNLKGDFIKEWPSASEAARFYGICKTSIIKCCNGKQKTSCGFIWKYKN